MIAQEIPANRGKRPGRKPLGDKPMTAAEKQRAYRQRQQKRAWDAVAAPDDASRVTLLDALAMCLERIDNYAGPSEVVRANMREGAETAVRELVTRYGLRI